MQKTWTPQSAQRIADKYKLCDQRLYLNGLTEVPGFAKMNGNKKICLLT